MASPWGILALRNSRADRPVAAPLVIVPFTSLPAMAPDATGALTATDAHHGYCKTLIARAITRSTVSAEIPDSTSMSIFIRRVRGIASVGLNAMEFVNDKER